MDLFAWTKQTYFSRVSKRISNVFTEKDKFNNFRFCFRDLLLHFVFLNVIGQSLKNLQAFLQILSDKLIETVLVVFTRTTPQTGQKAFVDFKGDYSGSLAHILNFILMIFLANQIFGYWWFWSYKNRPL